MWTKDVRADYYELLEIIGDLLRMMFNESTIILAIVGMVGLFATLLLSINVQSYHV